MKYLITHKHIVSVEILSDGRLIISADGNSIIPNIGLFIKNCGGRKKILERCLESDLSFDEFKRIKTQEHLENKRKKYEEYLKKKQYNQYNLQEYGRI